MSGILGAFRVQACYICESRILAVFWCLTFIQGACGSLAINAYIRLVQK